jgi:hypothetical protein
MFAIGLIFFFYYCLASGFVKMYLLKYDAHIYHSALEYGHLFKYIVVFLWLICYQG